MFVEHKNGLCQVMLILLRGIFLSKCDSEIEGRIYNGGSMESGPTASILQLRSKNFRNFT